MNNENHGNDKNMMQGFQKLLPDSKTKMPEIRPATHSKIYYFNEQMQLCEKEEATYARILELDENNQRIRETFACIQQGRNRK